MEMATPTTTKGDCQVAYAPRPVGRSAGHQSPEHRQARPGDGHERVAVDHGGHRRYEPQRGGYPDEYTDSFGT